MSRHPQTTEYDTDQNGVLPYSPLGIWFAPDGYFWIDTQDGSTHPFRTLQLGEAETWHTLDEAAQANLQALDVVPATHQ